MALATTSVSADEIKSLLALAERDYRLSNFGSAFSKTKKVIQSDSFKTLQPKKQHEAAKACIKYAFCNNSQAEILEWLKDQGEKNFANQGLYVCEWVACSLDRGGSQYQQHTQLKNAENALKDVYSRASAGTDREAQLTRDMVAELLLQKVLLPHTDAHSCARWLTEHASQLSPSVKADLEAAVQAKIADLEARRKPVIAAKAAAAAAKTATLAPAKASSSTSWLFKTYNDYMASIWNDKQNWKYGVGVVVAIAVLYSLFVERKGIQQAPSREGAGSGNNVADMLQDAELGR